MTKLKIPAGFIDVTRDSGTVISLIGDNVWQAFPANDEPEARKK